MKNPAAMQETEVISLSQEYSQEKEMATHSSIVALRIPWTKEPGRLCPWGHKESSTTEQCNTSYFHVGKGAKLRVCFMCAHPDRSLQESRLSHSGLSQESS